MAGRELKSIAGCQGGSQRAEWGSREAREGVVVCVSLFLSLPRALILLFPSLWLCLWVSWTLGSEREVVVNMLNSLSRNRTLPQIAPRCGCVDPLPGRLPQRGYQSPCSGRHYCLRGMDYCASGMPPSTERRLQPLCSVQPTVRFAGIRPPWPGSTH